MKHQPDILGCSQGQLCNQHWHGVIQNPRLAKQCEKKSVPISLLYSHWCWVLRILPCSGPEDTSQVHLIWDFRTQFSSDASVCMLCVLHCQAQFLQQLQLLFLLLTCFLHSPEEDLRRQLPLTHFPFWCTPDTMLYTLPILLSLTVSLVG